jgi:iron complex transport system ATP-binding protein
MSITASSSAVAVESVAADHLRFSYGGQLALEDVSLRAHAGELVAIVGPNGCGKSTLLKLMVGALQPTGGLIAIDGRATRMLSRLAMARRVALVPQMAGATATIDGALGTGGFTVKQAVLMSRYAAHASETSTLGRLVAMGFETEADLRLADVAMWNADVHHLADRPVDTLSGGERQRVAIARAFAQETAVMLLDEPTSALDLYHQFELVAQLQEFARGKRIVMMVTHDLNLASRCATRVVVMDRGRVVADGEPAKVLTPAVLEPVYRVKVKTDAAALRFERSG